MLAPFLGTQTSFGLKKALYYSNLFQTYIILSSISLVILIFGIVKHIHIIKHKKQNLTNSKKKYVIEVIFQTED